MQCFCQFLLKNKNIFLIYVGIEFSSTGKIDTITNVFVGDNKQIINNKHLKDYAVCYFTKAVQCLMGFLYSRYFKGNLYNCRLMGTICYINNKLRT